MLCAANSDMASTLSRALKERGFEVVDSGSADAALIDLSDAGATAAAQLRRSPLTRHVPIVAVVPKRRLEAPRGDLPEWADDCLASPFDVAELGLRVQTAVDLGRALAEQRALTESALAGEWSALPMAAEEREGYQTPSLVGQVVAGCRLDRRLGASSRGVYVGEHLVLGIPVCVKLVPASLADWSPAEVERFLRGARAAARVEHPNVVPVLNAGREQDHYYVVRRYIDGTPLDETLRNGGAMPVADALACAHDVALGLAAAHHMHVIHRDVKPGNIILTREGGANVIDFGLARPLDPRGISSTGEVIGTPQYMSPEQCDGDLLDARADVYSLGATLCHMLAGHPPFEADTLVALLRLQISEEPAPLRTLEVSVPNAVNDVVMRMLAKSREERYASMEDVASALASLASS